jgi:hypothetical protein
MSPDSIRDFVAKWDARLGLGSAFALIGVQWVAQRVALEM